ncbi:MAG: hypothetical protein F7C82_04170 [Desulfurococcales archaeon]|nr:hypothetical protein [Desulfurococcales archaeon]MCE4626289.1 hypothetical protein [Desulfurococcales archaeon]MCE4629454.1 hypothetical protein [Desulfurococcales archaeon]
MATSSLINTVVIIIVIISLPAVAWFFKFRKTMIKKQVNILRYLENEYMPKDQTYWYLGYLVGFRGKYRINRGKLENVYVLYTMPPYHVFFYLPIIWLFKKKERLEIIHQLKENNPLRGEAHMANMKIRSIKLSMNADLRDFSKYKTTTINMKGVEYKVYYTGGNALDIATNLFNTLISKVNVFRVSVDASRNSILVSFEPKTLEDIGFVIDALRRITRSWTE